MSSHNVTPRWNVQQNTSNEPWRDEIQEYALLIDAVASGDRSRSLKLLASYILTNNEHGGLSGQGQPPDAEVQEDEQYGGEGYQEDEMFTGQHVYGNEAGFADEEQYPQDGGELEYAFNPDEYAEYGGGDGEYQPEYDGANGIDGEYMSGGVNEEPDQNNAYPEDGYRYDETLDNGTDAFERDDAYYTGFENEEAAADSYQNEPQTWSDDPGGEWRQRHLPNPPGTAHQLRHDSFDTNGGFSQEDHRETDWEGEHQKDLGNENGASSAKYWDAKRGANGGAAHFEPTRRFQSLHRHGRGDRDTWNQGDFDDDSADWEDASVEDEDHWDDTQSYKRSL